MAKESPREREVAKEIDVARVVNHLNHAFEEATAKMGRAVSPYIMTGPTSVIKNKETPSGNELYQLQVEFTYLINEVSRGAKYIVPKVIAECNEFIEKIIKSRKEQPAT